jgi:hypothetical protein
VCRKEQYRGNVKAKNKSNRSSVGGHRSEERNTRTRLLHSLMLRLVRPARHFHSLIDCPRGLIETTGDFVWIEFEDR